MFEWDLVKVKVIACFVIQYSYPFSDPMDGVIVILELQGTTSGNISFEKARPK